MTWIDKYINEYYAWLKDNTYTSHDSHTGWTAITTPYPGLFNDTIEIYAKRNLDNSITLSDDADTLRNLELKGVTIDNRSEKRTDWLSYILLNYGVTRTPTNELTVTAIDTNFNQKKFNLISAILEVSEMEALSSPDVKSMFREDVQNYLETNNILYTPNVSLIGAAKLNYNIDFLIPGRDKEIMVKPFNTIHTNNLSSFLFAFEDIKPTRERQTGKTFDALAIINDGTTIKENILEALHIKGVTTIFWNNRDNSNEIEKLRIA